jgi:signal recognition particle receptor subunit beta
MVEPGQEQSQVNARIVYWGAEGSGKSSNLRLIRAKLRPDHRGELRSVPTRLDPTVTYEELPIKLGEIAGVRTCIDVVSVPGGAEHAPTRKQLLDRVDGVVLVIDSQRQRIDDNIAAFEELRRVLASYGRNFQQVPIVVQYNKRDLADSFAIEELHRKLDLRGAAAFEADARRGTGVLQCLTTISKRVIRVLRERSFDTASAPIDTQPLPSPPAPRAAPVTPPAAAPAAPVAERANDVEQAIHHEHSHPEAREIAETADRARAVFEASFGDSTSGLDRDVASTLELGSIEAVGRATKIDARSVRVPLRLKDAAGQPVKVALTIRLDPLTGGSDD